MSGQQHCSHYQHQVLFFHFFASLRIIVNHRIRVVQSIHQSLLLKTRKLGNFEQLEHKKVWVKFVHLNEIYNNRSFQLYSLL